MIKGAITRIVEMPGEKMVASNIGEKMVHRVRIWKPRGFVVWLIAVFGFVFRFSYADLSPGTTADPERQKPVPVVTTIAGKHRLSLILRTTGSVRANREIEVRPKVSGFIEKLPVERGDFIKKGDIITVIEHKAELAEKARLEAAVKVAEAELDRARAQLENASLERDRAEQLYKDKAIPKQRYDSIIAQYKMAVAQERLAEANLLAAKMVVEQIKIRIEDFTIRSPMDAYIASRYVDIGQMVTPASVIVRLIDESILRIDASIAQVSVASVRKGIEAIITADAYPNERFRGRVEIISPALDPKTRTLPVEIHTDGIGLNSGKRLLRPGMFVNVQIKLGSKEVVAIPHDALMRYPGTGVYYIFVVEDGKALLRTVKLGISEGNLVEIVSGLKEGERVVIEGQVNLKSGMPVVEDKAEDKQK